MRFQEGSAIETQAQRKSKTTISADKKFNNNNVDFEKNGQKKRELNFYREKLKINGSFLNNFYHLHEYSSDTVLGQNLMRILNEFELSTEADLAKYINDQIKLAADSINQAKGNNEIKGMEFEYEMEMGYLEKMKEFMQFYEAQGWYDESKEKKQNNLAEFFEKLHEKGGELLSRKEYLEFFEPIIKSNSQKRYTTEEMKSLQIEIINCKSASVIAGREVKRVVARFCNRNQYYKFVKGLYGASYAPGYGLYHLSSDFKGTIFEKTGIIIAYQKEVLSWDESVVGHEIRHSIDPNINKRIGYDRILSEVFAYYYGSLIDSSNSVGEDTSWNSFQKAISNKRYYDCYVRDALKKINKTKFNDLCQIVVAAVRDYRRRHNDIETQRMIVLCETLEDFFKKVGYEYPDFI